jgi:hypothetical protein
MKKLFILIGILLLILPLTGSHKKNLDFVSTGFSLTTGPVTKVIGDTGFTDNKVGVTDAPGGLLTVTFTRAAGSASTVDFYFQISYDRGTTWADFIQTIEVATNHSVISGTTVRVSEPIDLRGISHIRWSKVTNNDVANALTAVNVTISY